jgi:hypothetical protein
MYLVGQAYLGSLYFDSSKIQGVDGGFIAPAVDEVNKREQTLSKLTWYNAN